MMDINYLKGRFEHAKALDACVVKIDIKEFASLLEWIDEKKCDVVSEFSSEEFEDLQKMIRMYYMINDELAEDYSQRRNEIFGMYEKLGKALNRDVVNWV